MQRLNEDQIEKLIVLVKKKPPLYDKASPGIRNVRDKLWKEIAKKLQANEIDCRTAWRSLRDQFQKARKENNPKSRRHKYYDKLLFLKEYVAPACFTYKSNNNNLRKRSFISPKTQEVEGNDMSLSEEILNGQEPYGESIKVEKDDSESFLINIFPDNPLNTSVESDSDGQIMPEANSTVDSQNLDYLNPDNLMVEENPPQIVNYNNNITQQQQLMRHSLRISKDSQQVSTTTLNNFPKDVNNISNNSSNSSSLVIKDSRGIYKFFESLASTVEHCNFTTIQLLELQSKIYNFSRQEITKIIDKRSSS